MFYQSCSSSKAKNLGLPSADFLHHLSKKIRIINNYLPTYVERTTKLGDRVPFLNKPSDQLNNVDWGIFRNYEMGFIFIYELA